MDIGSVRGEWLSQCSVEPGVLQAEAAGLRSGRGGRALAVDSGSDPFSVSQIDHSERAVAALSGVGGFGGFAQLRRGRFERALFVSSK